jgi:hypothetical protein
MFVRFFETEAFEAEPLVMHPVRDKPAAPKATNLRKSRLFILFMSHPFKLRDYCHPSHLFK